MEPRERILSALAHVEPDRVPLEFQAHDPALRRAISEADVPTQVRERFLRGDVDILRCQERRNDPAFRSWHVDTPSEAIIDDWGRASLRHADSGESLLTRRLFYPLAKVHTPEGLAAYPWPDMTAHWRWRGLADAVRASHACGRATIGQMSQTLVELCYELRSMEQLFVDFRENPAIVERLFDIITDIRCVQARRLAEAGVDILRIGDDLATQQALLISPAMYRQWVKPRHRAVIDAARAVSPRVHFLYHSDGNIEELIPDLIDIGVTAVNPVQPECIEPAMVKRRWGDRVTIWGASSTQQTLAFGQREDVVTEVEQRMRTIAPGGGYVVNFVNVVWSPRSRRNLLDYLTAVQEIGVYC